MTIVNKVIAALGFLGIGGSVMAFMQTGSAEAGTQAAAWIISLFLAAILIVVFLAKREAARWFSKIDAMPDKDWFDNIEDSVKRIPSNEWFLEVSHSITEGRGFREEMQARVGYIEGKLGIRQVNGVGSV